MSESIDDFLDSLENPRPELKPSIKGVSFSKAEVVSAFKSFQSAAFAYTNKGDATLLESLQRIIKTHIDMNAVRSHYPGSISDEFEAIVNDINKWPAIVFFFETILAVNRRIITDFENESES